MSNEIKTAIGTALTAGNDQSLITALSNRQFRVVGLQLSCGAAAASCFFESATTTAITPTFSLAINSSIVLPISGEAWGYFGTKQSEALTVSVTGTGPLGVLVQYVIL